MWFYRIIIAGGLLFSFILFLDGKSTSWLNGKIPSQEKWLNKYDFLPEHHKRSSYDKDIDCKVKSLAYNYSKTILEPSANFESIYDALQLSSLCGLSKKDYVPVKQPKSILQLSTSHEVYVDSQRGNDQAEGDIRSPLQTIQSAVHKCRSKRLRLPSKTDCKVVLSGGYHFLNDTIHLGPSDSGTAIVPQNGDAAIISGGKELKTQWSNYMRTWQLYENMSPFFEAVTPGKSSANIKYYGEVESAFDCQQQCFIYTKCTSYGYFGPKTGNYSSMCYFRLDGLWNPIDKYGVTGGKLINIYVADVSNQGVKSFSSMFVNGRRAVRARYPNGNPETTRVFTKPNGYVDKAVSWIAPKKKSPATELHLDKPLRANSLFPTFQIGIGGPVEAFNPPKSYWGTAHPAGGGGATYKVPSGLEFSPDLEFTSRKWSHPETGIIHAFQSSYWGNWQFRIDSRNDTTNILTWSYGGFQEARGSDHGGQWYVENIFEELDAANEWYLDEKEMKLYYFPNGTSSLPDQVIVPQVDSLISVVGSKRVPVTDIKIHGVTFMHSADTFMEDYEVPSGGDWAVHRNAAVFLQGTENALVDGCVFDSPGGNGIMLSDYNLNATISNNELFRLGDNGIVLLGSTELLDGTDGKQPRHTHIMKNIVRENGVWGKQTYAVVQSLACDTLIDSNVFFNGPRGGINFNDGFGGGNQVQNSLLFNFVRETHEHGPINSWDRQPYLTRVQDGLTVSLRPKENSVTHNFIISNYQSVSPIDHDDGSCYWTDSSNLLVYGGFKNFLGHTKHATNNYYIFPDRQSEPGMDYNFPVCAFTSGQTLGSSGYGDVWTDNTCIINNPSIYSLGSCEDGKLEYLIPYFANNRFYSPAANITIKCGDDKWTLEQFQARGFDVGSVSHDMVDNDEVIAMSKSFFGMV